MQRSTLLVFTLTFLCALMLYGSTAAPSLTWAHGGTDGGDLITASLTNGVPHPPGYPTYVTLGQLIAQVSGGDVAYRFNLFSAVCMALAAAFTASSLMRLMSPALPQFLGKSVALVASLFFVTAPMVWGQATIAEVHALNAWFVAQIVFLIIPVVLRCELPSTGRLTLAAGLWGVALGNSITIAALAPLFLAAWWRSRSAAARHYGQVLPIIAFFAGLSVYALIPLRAAQHPPVNWGDATSLDRFLALITAEIYHGYALGTPPADLITRLVAFAQLMVIQYGWLGIILGALGIYHALVNPNKSWRWLAVTIALYVLFALTYSTADSALYLIPVWMFGAWAIARGLVAVMVASRRIAQRAPLFILLLAFALGPALNILAYFPAMDLRDDRAPAEFADRVLTAAPAKAIIVTENDGQTFALWYHRHVVGQRFDVAVVDRRLAGYPWYDAMLRAQGSAPQLPEYDPPETWADRLAQLNPRRTVCIVDRESAQMTCRP